MDPNAHARRRLIVFTRAPEPGRVKTRLAASLGPERACALHAAFLEDVAAIAAGAAPSVVLCAAGDAEHPHLCALAARHGMRLAAQSGGDLGARLTAAMGEALSGGAREVAVIGSDSPALTGDHLARAFAALSGADAVLGPAADGGYWLVGARRPIPEAFTGIPWGGPDVLAATERRLREARIDYRLVDRSWDVDEPADLERLRRHLEVHPDAAPATRRLLDAWGDSRVW